MSLKIKTAPLSEPVQLADMRLYLGITQSSDNSRDSIIQSHITSARRWAEEYTKSVFITQTWVLYDECFDDDCYDLKSELQSVASIKYYDLTNTLQTLDPTFYDVDTVDHKVHLAYNKVWPLTYNRPNAIQIEHVSGFGSAASVPEDIKSAIKMVVGHWENYQSTIEGSRISTIPYAVEQLLKPFCDTRWVFS